MDASAQLRAALSDRYVIEREIGAGGMATVYLARDVKHNRKVALKVLRPELGAVLGVERFLSEIEVTANLQHPHLLPLFDSGEVDGVLFYVMPYVQGESLRDRLDRERQLPVDEAIRIAVAVAGALDYAHRHNVIHRDLKPENILLHDGQPLVADFGIALAISNAGGARVTQTGLSLGTPQYMSPEQATGDRLIDARSDIYSLGAMVYEMLTGEPPHIGNTVQAIIARVLTDRPHPVRAQRPNVPEHVDAAVIRALEKLPADRFATASGFADALTDPRAMVLATQARTIATFEAVPTAAALQRRRIALAAPWLLVAILLLIVAALARVRDRTGVSVMLTQLSLPDSITPAIPAGVTVALSPDGSKLAFVGRTSAGDQAIYLRPMNGLGASILAGTEGGNGPIFSPDGSSVLFTVQTALKKVPVAGGPALLIGDSPDLTGNTTWNQRNEILSGYGGRLWRLSSEGGAPSVLATVDTVRGHVRYSWPHFLPGNKAALITLWKNTGSLPDAELGLVRLRDGRVTELGVHGFNPRIIAGNILLFGRADGTVFAAPFSVRRQRLTGNPIPVLQNVYMKSGGAVELTVSETGMLVFKSGGLGKRELMRVSRTGVASTLVGDLDLVEGPRIGPAGRRIALSIPVPRPDVWTYDLVTRALMRVTNDGASERPEWSPDGQRIAFVNRDGGSTLVKWKSWDGSGPSEVLYGSTNTPFFDIEFGRSFHALRAGVGGPASEIWIVPADSPGAARPFLDSPAQEFGARISPDGRAMAYVSNETGRREVYVRPLPGPGARVQISNAGGDEPMWSPLGRELFYRTTDHFISATIVQAPELDVSRRDTLFTDLYLRSGTALRSNYDVFPNGNDFVFVRNLGTDQAKLFAIANWTEEVRAKLRAARQSQQ